MAVKLSYKPKTPPRKPLCANDDLLELLQGLVVQAESWVSCQVQLLQLGRQIFRQRDLTQLIAAQVHALKTGEEEIFTLLAFSSALTHQAQGLVVNNSTA